LGKSKGNLVYATLFMELLAPYSQSFARFAWMTYADVALNGVKNAELLATTADHLLEFGVKEETKEDEQDEDCCVNLFDEQKTISLLNSVFEMASTKDKLPSNFCKIVSPLLDLRVVYPEGKMISASCFESILTGLEKHAGNDDYRAYACAALVQSLALQSNKAFTMLVDKLKDHAKAATSVILSIATTRAVDWLPEKPLQQFVSKATVKANTLEEQEKSACLEALKEINLTIEDPERNKPVVKSDDEEAKEEDEEGNEEDAEEDNDEDGDEEGDEASEGDDDDDDDEDEDDDEEKEEGKRPNGLKPAPQGGSKCIIIYAIVVGLLAFVIAGCGSFVMLHCDEYPLCLQFLDYLCPRIRPLCENYNIPYNIK